MAFILDTDLISILQSESRPASDRLSARVSAHPSAEICTTIVNFQEQVNGWLAYLNRSRSEQQILLAYEQLGKILDYYRKSHVFPFDGAAQLRFTGLRRQRVRIGTLDLRIASIALATGSTLLSRNLSDFRKVPDLTVEDWSA